MELVVDGKGRQGGLEKAGLKQARGRVLWD